jgi:hypothetical protein
VPPTWLIVAISGVVEADEAIAVAHWAAQALPAAGLPEAKEP